MIDKTLASFCEEHSQARAAEILGCTQSAVSQMKAAGRDVHIVVHDDGSYSHYEMKHIRSQKAA